MTLRDKPQPWEHKLADLVSAAPYPLQPDPMRYDASWRAHVVDLWRQVAGIPSAVDDDRGV